MGQGNPSTFQILRLLQGALDQGISFLPQVQFHGLHLCQALGEKQRGRYSPGTPLWALSTKLRALETPRRARVAPAIPTTDLPELLDLLGQAALGAVPLQLGQPLLQLLDLGIAGCVLPQPLHLCPQALHLLGVGSVQCQELLRQPLLLLGLGSEQVMGCWGHPLGSPSPHQWEPRALVTPHHAELSIRHHPRWSHAL